LSAFFYLVFAQLIYSFERTGHWPVLLIVTNCQSYSSAVGIFTREQSSAEICWKQMYSDVHSNMENVQQNWARLWWNWLGQGCQQHWIKE
jgi:hypothetical protein